jgi:Xaa-Pro aminopeptidase
MSEAREHDEDERVRRLLDAQARAEALFEAVGEQGIIRAGVTDREASRAVAELAAERFGVERHWHKRIVRSGPNTLQPYHENPPDRTMTDDDIAFADFGPVFEGWEADFGRTWVLGDDPVKRRLVEDLPAVFDEGLRFHRAHPDLTAAELYAEVVRLAEARGWAFGNDHCGHLVGEFPHENFPGAKPGSRLTAGNDRPIRTTDPSGRVAHWILEVHLVDRDREVGGFYEELLTISPRPT